MNIYIFSPCDQIIKIANESYYLTKNNVVLLKDFCKNQLLELIPKNDFLPCYFLKSEKNYYKNLRLIDLYDGFLIIPKLIRERNLPRETLFFKTQGYYGREFNIAVSTDGGIKLIISGDYYHEEIELLFKPEKVNLIPCDNAPYLFISLEKDKKHLVCVKLPDIKILFNSLCDEYNLSSELSITTRYNDVSRHECIDLWKIGDPFLHIGRKINSKNSDYPTEVIPYAFLQEIALCGDYSHFLSDELKEKANLLPSFIGNFDYIIPPFLAHKKDKIGLVFKSDIKFISFSINQNKIHDLSIDD